MLVAELTVWNDPPGQVGLVAVAGIVGVLLYVWWRLSRTAEAKRLGEDIIAAQKSGDFVTALALCRRAEEVNPNLRSHAAIQGGIATLCLMAGAVREGLDRIRSAVSMSPGSQADPAMIDGFCTTALSFQVADVYEEAEKLLRGAMAANPDRRTLKGTLGGILFELGRESEAHPLLQELSDSSEDAMDIGISAAYLSAIAAKCGDSSQAASYRDRALDHLPEHPIVRRLLGLV
jgi:Tfp pilus assembly protein PilF